MIRLKTTTGTDRDPSIYPEWATFHMKWYIIFTCVENVSDGHNMVHDLQVEQVDEKPVCTSDSRA